LKDGAFGLAVADAGEAAGQDFTGRLPGRLQVLPELRQHHPGVQDVPEPWKSEISEKRRFAGHLHGYISPASRRPVLILWSLR
jgi:hypothetical protein